MRRVLVALLGLGVAAAAGPAAAARNVQINWPGAVFIDENGDHIRVRFSDGARTIKFEAEGEFELSSDESDLVRLAPDAEFRVEERRHGKTQCRFEALGLKGGGIARGFEAEGEKRDMTAADHAWLKETIQALLSRTTFDAGPHVERLIQQGGIDGALSAIESMDSDDVQAAHYRELLKRHGSEPGLPEKVVEQASKAMDSDHRLSELLRLVMEKSPRDRTLALACAHASEQIGSDHERRRTLQAVLEGSDPDPDVSRAVAVSAAGIGSDHERAEALISLVLFHPLGTAEAPEFFAAASGIGSDHERGRVLRELVLCPNLEPAVLVGVLECARGIGSDHEGGQLLVDLAGSQEVTGEVRTAYLETALHLGSQHWQKQALGALGEPTAERPN
jgi:hypothetical protein